jgi:outer membrane protein OmpA-like peptidoglycan-associated protein
VANRFELGLTIPVLIQSGDASMLASAEGTTLGDVALHAKAKLIAVGPVALGFGAVVTAPTAKDDQYAGYGGPSGQGILLASHQGRRLLLSANAGFLARKTDDFAGVQQGNAFTYGAGGGYRVTPSIWVAGEVFGDVGLVADSQPSIQALLGVRYRMGDTITVGLGGGFGMIDAVGVPKARGFLLVSYSPAMRPQLAFEAPPPPRDERDPDGDKIANADDKCPNEAEDADVFEDEDGCPELDNDSDGVLDAMDQCKDQAEDADGFEDDDGCADADNDKDGIADATDVCPNEGEDKDGTADLDGCPDNDNDHDGVVDGKDRCPAKPETINGNRDDDGCPDAGDSLVLLAAERIELLEPVKFIGKTAKLAKGSANVLGQVAATLRANPEVLKIRVTAHVHPRDGRDADQKLSDDRAAAVKEWLVLWGIKIDRVDAKGFGSQKPLVKNQRKAEEINDRIEFVIMEKQ